jgi:TPP-dependent pyruvate/acetoin dehydrogenase alpha subunit
VQKELLEEWRGRDPIDRYASRLGGKHGFTEQEIEEIRRGVDEAVESSVRKALDSPMPDGSLATQGVFAESWQPLGDGQAPWSFWRQAEAQGNGSGNGAVKEVAA